MHLCDSIEFELVGTNTSRQNHFHDNEITVPIQQLRLQAECQICTSLAELIDYRLRHKSTWTKQYGAHSFSQEREPTEEETRDAVVTLEITQRVVRNWSFGINDTTLRNVLRAGVRVGHRWVDICLQRSGPGGRVPVSSKPKTEYGDNEITFIADGSWNNGENVPQSWNWEENPNPVAASLQSTFGRRRELLVDFEMLKEWIKVCDQSHDLCNREDISPIQTLRLISVRDMCIKELEGIDLPPFATLSYVWGSTSFQRLTREILPNLKEPGGLKAIGLPATIEDTLLICEKLQIGYLWVDSLCIIQDDEYDMIEFIDKMDLIYNQSTLTIVAASGLNADSRIPGINSVPRTLEQRHIEARGVPLIDCVGNNMLEFNSKFEEPGWVSRTPWAQRAWTFQEALVSRRVLFFTAEQVYWSCHHGQLSEDTVEYFPPNSGSTAGAYQRINDEFRFFEYNNVALTFSTRKLTFEEDIIRAYQGTQNYLQKRWKNQRFSWGLPHGAFGTMLMWEWSHGKQRRLRRGTHSIQQKDGTILKVPFPSWSWLSWTNDGTLADFYGDEDGAHSPSFFVYDSSHDLISIRDGAHGDCPYRWLGRLLALAPTGPQDDSSVESAMIGKKLLTEPAIAPSLKPIALIFFTEVAKVRYDPFAAGEEDLGDLQFTSYQYPFSIKVGNKFYRITEDQQTGIAAEHAALHEIELVAVFAGQMTKPRHHRGQYRLYCWPVIRLEDGRRVRASYMATIVYLSLWKSLPQRSWELVVLT